MKTYLINKKAYREYEITDKYSTGIKLYGYEVKSIVEGKGTLRGSYVKILKNIPMLIGMDIPKYSKAGDIFEFDAIRDRTLLLNKSEIEKIGKDINQKGFTAFPLKLISEKNILKLVIGVGKGKKKQSLKQDLIKKQVELDMKRNQKFTAQNRPKNP